MKRNLLAVAVLAAFAGQASAASVLHQVSGTETITNSVNYVGDEDYGILAMGTNVAGTFTGEMILVEMSKTDLNARGVRALNSAKLVLGDRQKSDVTIKSIQKGSVEGKSSIAVQVDTYKDDHGGQMEIKGKTVTIHAEGTNGGPDVRAIHVATNNTNYTQVARLAIDAETVNISAITEKPNRAVGSTGVSAMSSGEVTIKGNTTITADDAIVARGFAKVLVNEDGKHSTVINGNVNFSYHASTSGTPVDATVVLNLVGPESSWTGNTVVS